MSYTRRSCRLHRRSSSAQSRCRLRPPCNLSGFCKLSTSGQAAPPEAPAPGPTRMEVQVSEWALRRREDPASKMHMVAVIPSRDASQARVVNSGAMHWWSCNKLSSTSFSRIPVGMCPLRVFTNFVPRTEHKVNDMSGILSLEQCQS